MTRTHALRWSLFLTALAWSSQAVAQEPPEEAPPVCFTGGPYLSECTGAISIVAIDGSASYDPEGTPLTFAWFEECPFGSFDDPSSPTPNFLIDNTGVCLRSCFIVNRVTSGGQTVSCGTYVTVQDTTGPLMSCPPDVIDIWAGGPGAGQTDPLLTGFATAVDCDPNPLITYVDVLQPGTAPGEPETIVTRTWTGLDFCGNFSSCIQTITLLSPSQPLGGRLDFKPGSCPNTAANTGEGLLSWLVIGTSVFDANQVDRSTLRMQRKDNFGQAIVRMQSRVQDKGRPPWSKASCACASSLPDGRPDIQITTDYNEVYQAFEFANEFSGTQVEVCLSGRKLNGQWFTLTDCVTVP